jgi:hypothetical protein
MQRQPREQRPRAARLGRRDRLPVGFQPQPPEELDTEHRFQP